MKDQQEYTADDFEREANNIMVLSGGETETTRLLRFSAFLARRLTACEAANRERNSDSIPLHPSASCGEVTDAKALLIAMDEILTDDDTAWNLECKEAILKRARAVEAAMRVATPNMEKAWPSKPTETGKGEES